MVQKYDTFLKKQKNKQINCIFSPKNLSTSRNFHIFAPAYQSGKPPMSSRPVEMEM